MKPTQEQLDIINQLKPQSVSDLTLEDVEVLSVIATNNLISRSLEKWSVDDLGLIAALLPGLPFTLNHEWNEVDEVQGLIFDAKVVSRPASASELMGGGLLDENKMIIEKDGGFFAVECEIAIPSFSPLINGLKFGAKKVSLGGFNYADMVCPLCDESFFEDDCPHGIPGYPGNRDGMTAPYAIRSGIYDLGELSLVLIPNMPGAEVI
jgi:hypothetical protein